MTTNEQVRIEKEFVAKDDPRFPEVHCTTVQVAKDVQYCTWFGGTKEGTDDVKIWFSKRVNTGEWSPAKCIAGKEGVVHWNPVSFLPDAVNSPNWLIVYYKTGTPIPTWVTYSIETLDGGETWSSPKELVPGDRNSGGRGPQKNPPIILSDGTWLAGASKEVSIPNDFAIWDSFSDRAPKPGPNDTWKQGDIWEKSDFVKLPTSRGKPDSQFPGEGCIQPSAWEDPKNPGCVTMLLRSSNGWMQRTDSKDYGKTWSPARNSPLPNNNSGQCVTRTRSGKLVCAYNPVGVNWGLRTPLICSISDDNGETWKLWCTLEDQPAPRDFEKIIALDTGITNNGLGEFSYPTVTPTSEDDVEGVWISYTWQRRGVVVSKLYVPK